MDLTIYPKKLSGIISAIPSKSAAHRHLICAALADAPTTIYCPSTSRDIETTATCLSRLGAKITRTSVGYTVIPMEQPNNHAVLPCEECAATLRFLLPIVGALGIDAVFVMGSRLSKRPLEPLMETMENMGCSVQRVSPTAIHCQGQLHSGNFSIPGNVSSQFITGLLFACVLLEGESTISICGRLESSPYIDMTISALSHYSVNISLPRVKGTKLVSPKVHSIEGDWSNSSCYFAANALGSAIEVTGLQLDSTQGDRAISSALEKLEIGDIIDVSDIPDLVPILAVVAAAKQGTVFHHIGRLRTKESDRVASVLSMLHSLGIHAIADADTMTIHPGIFHAGTVDSFCDHRIAMAAAIAATCADGPVTITNTHCVEKSYPDFWEDYRKLGGNYEQHIW